MRHGLQKVLKKNPEGLNQEPLFFPGARMRPVVVVLMAKTAALLCSLVVIGRFLSFGFLRTHPLAAGNES